MKYVLLYSDANRIPVSDKQAEALEVALQHPECPKFIKIGERESLVAVSSISGIHAEEEMKDAHNYAANRWQCKYGFWHEKNERYCKCNRLGDLKIMEDIPEGKIRMLEGKLKLQ